MAISIHGRSSALQGVVRKLTDLQHFHNGLVWSVFVASRLLLLFAQLVLLPTAGDGDIGTYARYAAAYEAASHRGTSVYDYCTPEYPHLALVVMALPRAGMIDVDSEPIANPDGLVRYRSLFRVEMAFFDLLAFATAWWLVRTQFRDESLWRRTTRLLTFGVAGLLLPTLLYTRLDVVLGALVLLSLALLVSRWHYAWSFAALAAAVDFKLVPVVLVPLWVVASLPPALVGGVRSMAGVGRLLAVGSFRAGVAGAFVVAWALPAFLLSGGRSLEFLAYHEQRGLEIGSLYSSGLLLLRPLGYPCDFNFTFGSVNVDAAAAPLLVRLSPLVTLGLVSAATLVSCRLLLRRKYEDSRGAPRVHNPAADLAAGTALVLAAFVAGNKVFSPQYLLWLAPLVPLLPSPIWSRRLCVFTFAAASAISTLTMIAWQCHIIGDPNWVGTMTTVTGPTPLGSALLIARNGAFLGFVAALAVRTATITEWAAEPLPYGRDSDSSRSLTVAVAARSSVE